MIEFGNSDSMSWNGTYEEVRFDVIRDGQSIQCRVSRQALEDHCGNPKDAGACLDAANAHFNAITDKVGHKIAIGAFELDGSVLLSTSDW